MSDYVSGSQEKFNSVWFQTHVFSVHFLSVFCYFLLEVLVLIVISSV